MIAGSRPSIAVAKPSVSTDDQKLDLQHDALRTAGCDEIFDDKISGTGARLPGRDALLAYARRTDVVVVWKLDRLGRSLRDLIEIVNELNDRGMRIDRHHDAGWQADLPRLRSQFEAEVLRERTRAGLAAARDRGAKLGRTAQGARAQP